MPRRIIRRLSRRRHKWTSQWFLRPFRRVLEDPKYWSLHRRNVTRAFALGLFVSFIPLPVHVVVAALLAILLGLNLPVAVAAVFFTNPLTVVPLFFLAYWTGSRILGLPMQPFRFELSWDWLATGLLPIWKPFLLGCFVLGAVTAVTGYLLLGALWHASLVVRYRRRKRDARRTDEENWQKHLGAPPDSDGGAS